MSVQSTLAEIRQRAERARIWQYQELADESKRLASALEHCLEAMEGLASIESPQGRNKLYYESQEELLAILEGRE